LSDDVTTPNNDDARRHDRDAVVAVSHRRPIGARPDPLQCALSDGVRVAGPVDRHPHDPPRTMTPSPQRIAAPMKMKHGLTPSTRRPTSTTATAEVAPP
jgi:hypothetical protein